jgi:hypothetical protein
MHDTRVRSQVGEERSDSQTSSVPADAVLALSNKDGSSMTGEPLAADHPFDGAVAWDGNTLLACALIEVRSSP